MSLLEKTCAAIVPADVSAGREAQRLLDSKTKPRRSLGLLEDLACRLAACRRTAELPAPTKAIVVMAADHGVADEGVSAYPAEVTSQMVRNFAAGGAAINVLARQAGARVVVVDMGTRHPTADIPGVLQHRLGPGTANFTRGAAMTRDTARAALETGIALAGRLIDDGIDLIGLGDMGIANTTTSSALTAVLLGLPVEKVTGRGTGIDETAYRRKVSAIERGLTVNRPQGDDAIDVLAKLGGFEIGGLVGVVLSAAAHQVPILLDGFITSVAGLLAVRLAPAARDCLIASHRSVEPGHAAILGHLQLRPLLDLDMRLGEGTGAALAMHLVEAAIHILRDMASFTDAGVTDAGA